MRGQNAFVFNLNMIIHIFLHLSNAFSAGPAGRRGRGEAFSRFWMPAAGGCVPFGRRTRAGIWCFFPKMTGGRAARKNRSARQPERCADRPKTSPRAGASHFYPRSPRGERPVIVGVVGIDGGISIHAPRKGSDSARSPACQSHHYFYPHSPQRGATRQPRGRLLDGPISIHTPRKRSDGKIQQTSKMDFAQKSQMKILNTQNRMQFCVSSIILT